MTKQHNKRLRRERYERNLEKDVNDHLEGRSGGQYCVVDRETGERFKGLSLKQAQAKWNSLNRAIILQDEHVRGTL